MKAEKDEEQRKERKADNLLNTIVLMAIILVAYQFGMHRALPLTAIGGLYIGLKRGDVSMELSKKYIRLAGPFLVLTAIGLFNHVVLPLGITGLFSILVGLLLQKKNIKTPLIAITGVLLVAGSLVFAELGYSAMLNNMLGEETSFAAPKFEVTDRSNQNHPIEEWKGKWIVLDFYATWCGPCKQELKELDAFYQEYQDNRNWQLLLVNPNKSEDTKEEIEQFIQLKNYDHLPFYTMNDTEVEKEFGLHAFPTLFIINPEGEVVWRHTGYAKAEQLKKYLEKIMFQ